MHSVKRFFDFFLRSFPGSEAYWEKRYADGGNSGVGSYADFAAFKAEVLNAFVVEHGIADVVEFGCGDGNQLTLANYPKYLGVDVSPSAVEMCRGRFAGDDSKRFVTLQAYAAERAALSLSLDVIFHLVEDAVFDAYMRRLFDAAGRFVGIYSSNTTVLSVGDAQHVRHRRFSDWIEAHSPGWELVQHIPNRYPYEGDYRTGSFADFYFYGAPAKPASAED